VVQQLLKGFRVLIASDHRDLVVLFAAMLDGCGAVALRAASVSDAMLVLDRCPHAMLLDTALPDDSLSVPAHAATVRVPIVALTLREPEPRILPARLHPFVVSFLHSTEIGTLCAALREAVGEAA
jgi:CheY-like chemotaxis protein